MSPYEGQTFFGFFSQLFIRLWHSVSSSDFSLASDEIQILALVGIAISSALVGSFLVLRKMTMVGNALSHTILLGILITFLMTRESILGEITYHKAEPMHIQSLLLASLGVGLLTAFLTETLHRKLRLQEDASIGFVFTTLFALGVTLATLLTRNSHIGTEIVMGSVDALQTEDLKLVWVIAAMNLVLTLLFYRGFLITTFDARLAAMLGFSATFFNYLLMAQVSATVVGAFRAVGVLMVLTFLTGPVLAARFLTHNLNRLIILAIVLGSACSVIGVALSRHFLSVYGLSLSTGGIVVCVMTLVFAVTALVKHAKG